MQIQCFKRLSSQFKKLTDYENGFSYIKVISVLGFDYKVELKLYVDIGERYFYIENNIDVTALLKNQFTNEMADNLDVVFEELIDKNAILKYLPIFEKDIELFEKLVNTWIENAKKFAKEIKISYADLLEEIRKCFT